MAVGFSVKPIALVHVATLLLFVCFMQTCTHARQNSKKHTHTIPTPTCTNADTLWSWLHNSTGLFCPVVSQTDGLLCPQLCRTNAAWLEIWELYNNLPTNEGDSSAHHRRVYGVGDGSLLFIWSWSLFTVCRTRPSLHTQTWGCRYESFHFFH